jgi:hypothetical protein
MDNERMVAVCIPYYKEYSSFTDFERLLLGNNIAKLGSYTIYFLIPERLANDASKIACRYMDLHIGFDVKMIQVANKHLESVRSYDRFLKSCVFYEIFARYDFVCICQLDAWIFRDELRKFAKFNYPLIGAPWLYQSNNGILRYLGTGNGGYSLRNVTACRKVLEMRRLKLNENVFKGMMREIIRCRIMGRSHSIKNTIHLYLLKIILKCRIFHNYFVSYLVLQEDMFLSLLMYSTELGGIMPSLFESASFSFEQFPDSLLKLTEKKLPTGCHAPIRYGQDFWSQFIPYCFVDAELR